jgi:hypothetical protein
VWEAWLAVLVVKKAPNVCLEALMMFDGGPVAELADTYRRCASCLAHGSTSCYTVFHWVEFKGHSKYAMEPARKNGEGEVLYCGEHGGAGGDRQPLPAKNFANGVANQTKRPALAKAYPLNFSDLDVEWVWVWARERRHDICQRRKFGRSANDEYNS